MVNKKILNENNIEFFKTNRGGDITFHGPGQIVCYPILDLDNFFTDIHKYLRFLEEIVIETLNDFGIKSQSRNGETGVWVKDKNSNVLLLTHTFISIGDASKPTRNGSFIPSGTHTPTEGTGLIPPP